MRDQTEAERKILAYLRRRVSIAEKQIGQNLDVELIQHARDAQLTQEVAQECYDAARQIIESDRKDTP